MREERERKKEKVQVHFQNHFESIMLNFPVILEKSRKSDYEVEEADEVSTLRICSRRLSHHRTRQTFAKRNLISEEGSEENRVSGFLYLDSFTVWSC